MSESKSFPKSGKSIWGSVEAAQPAIGFCDGCQMMGETFGSKVAAIEDSESGDMYDNSWQERTHESGFMAIRRTATHPLFEGLNPEMAVLEAHYWKLKSVPEGFQIFAESDITPIQMMAHETLPLYETQFHPEAFDEEHQDGRRFLENFFNLV